MQQCGRAFAQQVYTGGGARHGGGEVRVRAAPWRLGNAVIRGAVLVGAEQGMVQGGRQVTPEQARFRRRRARGGLEVGRGRGAGWRDGARAAASTPLREVQRSEASSRALASGRCPGTAGRQRAPLREP